MGKISALVIGSGGREHAICWKLSQSKKIAKLYCAPGNAGTAAITENVPIGAEDKTALADFALRKKIDFTVVGPDAALVGGVVDEFEKRGLKIFGPDAKAAIIEGSKVFTRDLLKRYNIPSAEYAVFTDAKAALDYLHEKGAPIVAKADGLAAGKGAIVCQTVEEAKAAIQKILVEKAFGESGNKMLLEEFLDGEEASFFAFSDGTTIKTMPSSQDHKRVFDNDAGPNCYSEDTEILTENGWKTFDIVHLREKVAIFDPKDNSIKFEEPKSKYWREYSGKMIHFKHRLLDLLVTPNHRMLVEKRKSKVISAYEAKDLGGENNIYLSGKWEGRNPKHFTLAAHDYKFNRKLKEQKIPFLNWVRFLGIYLSEGYTSNRRGEHRVFICQTKKSPHLKKIENIISKLPFKFKYIEKECKFRIDSFQLASVLKDFGTSKEKYIPTYIKNAKKETIFEFLKVFNMGDGDTHYGQMRFCSGSKKIIDGLQELILKCGHTGIITVDKRKTMVNPLNGKTYPASPIYAIEISKRQKVGIRKKDVHEVLYKGKIGCVTVSTGFVVVRRNSRIAVSGNTGGMGAYSPAPVLTKELEKIAVETIMRPTIDAMKKEGREFKGVLYCGLMITKNGPKVVEFNCRFGDPETQVILPRLESDLLPILQGCIDGTLAKQKIKWKKEACTCVVMASGGYPEHYEKGKEILGLMEAEKLKDTVVFHAGTKEENGKTVTSGGRVLGVTALGKTIKESIGNAYAVVGKISFEKMHYRTDIGQKALNRKG